MCYGSLILVETRFFVARLSLVAKVLPYLDLPHEPTITPPFGCKLCPDIKLLSALARNTKQVATSDGWPGLPIGLVKDFCASSFIVAGMSGVQIGPGQTAFTLIPCSICWFERPRVKATIAPLVEV